MHGQYSQEELYAGDRLRKELQAKRVFGWPSKRLVVIMLVGMVLITAAMTLTM